MSSPLSIEDATGRYVPILAGGLFENAKCNVGGEIISIRAADFRSEIGRIERHLLVNQRRGNDYEVTVRWRSNASAIDQGPNFERSKFLSLLRYHLKHRTLPSHPIEREIALEKTAIAPASKPGPFTELNVATRRVTLSVGRDGRIEGREDDQYITTPITVIEGSESVAAILERYEYIPTFVYAVKSPAPAVSGENRRVKFVLSCRFRFPYTDCWTAVGDIRFQLPHTGEIGEKLCMESIRNTLGHSPVEPASATVDEKELLAFVGALAKKGVSQYRFDLVYTPPVGRLTGGGEMYDRLEPALKPVIQAGKRGKEKEMAFHLSNHLAIAWEYMRPLFEEFDRAFAARLNDIFSRGDMIFHHLSAPMKTASSATLAEIYVEIEERPFYYTRKLDGGLGKLFIVMSPVGGNGAYQLSFLEALSLTGNMRRWIVEANEIEKLREGGFLDGNPVVSIFDAEKVDDAFYVFRTIELCNINFVAKTETESWQAIFSPLAQSLFSILRGHNIIIDQNQPTLIGRDNFDELLTMFEEYADGRNYDGGVLTAASAQYCAMRSDDVSKLRLKLKSQRRCTLDFLLKRVSPHDLQPYNIDVPPSAKAVYIAYTGGSLMAINNVPRPEVYTGVWRMRHFPSLMTTQRAILPCEFVTAILPNSHVAISTDADAPDFDDTIAECAWISSDGSGSGTGESGSGTGESGSGTGESGWFHPLFVREEKTAEYKSSTRSYGNEYRAALATLPAILDPIVPDTIRNIQSMPHRYFNTARNFARPEYEGFLLGCKVGKAILYGKYLSPAMLRTTYGRFGRRAAGSLSQRTLIELGSGRGSDLANAWCAGARIIFAIDPDVHALLRYETRASTLYRDNGSDPRAVQWRMKMRLPTPIIFPPSAYAIYPNPRWAIRTIIGGISDERDCVEKIWRRLVKDTNFPLTGVSALSIQFAIHYMWGTDISILNLKTFCDKVLAPEGVIAISYYDGGKIFSLLSTEEPENPWRKRGNGIELVHTSGTKMGMMKYRIEKRWSGNDNRIGIGKKIGVFLPTISPTIEEEYLVDNGKVITAFINDYEMIYTGPMLDEPSYLELLQTALPPPVPQNLPDCFSTEDYAYLQLIHLTVLAKPRRSSGRKRGGQMNLFGSVS